MEVLTAGPYAVRVSAALWSNGCLGWGREVQVVLTHRDPVLGDLRIPVLFLKKADRQRHIIQAYLHVRLAQLLAAGHDLKWKGGTNEDR